MHKIGRMPTYFDVPAPSNITSRSSEYCALATDSVSFAGSEACLFDETSKQCFSAVGACVGAGCVEGCVWSSAADGASDKNIAAAKSKADLDSLSSGGMLGDQKRSLDASKGRYDQMAALEDDINTMI